MVTKKVNKDALTAAEIKTIKAHLLELRDDAAARLKDKKIWICRTMRWGTPLTTLPKV